MDHNSCLTKFENLVLHVSSFLDHSKHYEPDDTGCYRQHEQQKHGGFLDRVRGGIEAKLKARRV